jgi:hypothetical protein
VQPQRIRPLSMSMDQFNLLRYRASPALAQDLLHPGYQCFLVCRTVDQRARACLVTAMLEAPALPVVLPLVPRAVAQPAPSPRLEPHLDSVKLSKCPLAPVQPAAPHSSERHLDLGHDRVDSSPPGRLLRPHRMLVLKKVVLRLRMNGTLHRRRLLRKVALRVLYLSR